MRRVPILLGSAAFFATISGVTIWLAVVSDGRWGFCTGFCLLVTIGFAFVAANEASP